MLNLGPNYQNKFWRVQNCKKIHRKIFLSKISPKCRICWQKTWTGCRINLKFGMQSYFFVLFKKPQNNFFIPGPVHCANIFQIFSFSRSSWNIWTQLLQITFNSSHNLFHILPAARWNCNWFYCQLFFSIWPCSTSPQIYIKSETEQRTISKYSVWNNQISIKWEQRNKFSLLELLLKDSHIVHWRWYTEGSSRILL